MKTVSLVLSLAVSVFWLSVAVHGSFFRDRPIPVSDYVFLVMMVFLANLLPVLAVRVVKSNAAVFLLSSAAFILAMISTMEPCFSIKAKSPADYFVFYLFLAFPIIALNMDVLCNYKNDKGK